MLTQHVMISRVLDRTAQTWTRPLRICAVCRRPWVQDEMTRVYGHRDLCPRCMVQEAIR